jgi:enoyl-CoA hydratase/carnithine racemase
MSDEGKVMMERREHVLLIGLDRATKRNAFDLPMYHALCQTYTDLERDDDLRCGVLFAHGDHFTAGIDLAQWAPALAAGGFPLPEGTIDPLHLGLGAPGLSKPMVVAVQGICLTLGIELMLAADVRVAAEDTRFAQIEVKRGIYPVGGATLRFPAEAGWGNAMRYLLTGDEFSAQEAHRMGLIQEVVPAGKQLERAVELAKTIAAQAPLAVRATLASARLARESEAQAAQRLLPDLLPIMQSEDAREGLASFLERRQGRFTGR